MEHLEYGRAPKNTASRLQDGIFNPTQRKAISADPPLAPGRMILIATSLIANIQLYLLPPAQGSSLSSSLSQPQEHIANMAGIPRPAGEDLLQSGILSDFVLKIGDNEIKAHRCILAAASGYFKALFRSNFKVSQCLGDEQKLYLLDLGSPRPCCRPIRA